MSFNTLPGDPPWLVKAASYLGFKEQPNNHGIQQFVDMGHVGEDGEPWCAIFVAAMLASTGYGTSGSAMARSYEHSPVVTSLSSPKRGCIVTFWRNSRGGGSGHVTFYIDTVSNGIECLGGNQHDGVCLETFGTDRVTGYWWPVGKVTTLPSSNFDICLPLVLISEGGNDDDPRDPGGRTSRGIIQSEWDKWRLTHPNLPSDVWQAPQDQVRLIYLQNYWNVLSASSLPPGVDYTVFDFGVNSGNSRSAKFLQDIVGTEQDGEIGQETIDATKKLVSADVVNKLCDNRLAFLQGLATWHTFGNGWTNRITRVRKDALKMTTDVSAVIPSTDDPVPTTTSPKGTLVDELNQMFKSQGTLTEQFNRMFK